MELRSNLFDGLRAAALKSRPVASLYPFEIWTGRPRYVAIEAPTPLRSGLHPTMRTDDD
jgi:hypothetical protein